MKAGTQQGGTGEGFGTGGDRDSRGNGYSGGDAGDCVGLAIPLQRQASSFDGHGVVSVGSSVGEEFQAGIGAFLLPEEEQVQTKRVKIHRPTSLLVPVVKLLYSMWCLTER